MPFLSNDLLAALPRLRRYARVLTEDPDSADEMVKETLTRARQLELESPPGPTVVVRLFSMLRSVYVDEFAPGRPHGPLPALHPRESNSLAGADSTGIASESNALRTDELLAHLLRLPLENREVLVLVAVERMSYDDIATLLGVPLATVLARLTQARESFRSDAVEATKSPKSGR
jgi:RNA polymerase sigma-70 factor (ECF subfamily)